METLTHWINSQNYVGRGATADVYNPATGKVTKQVPLAEQQEVSDAVAAAKAALPSWRELSLAKRQTILFNFRELLNMRKGELAEIITNEHGKVIDDALGEISRGQEVLEFALGLPHLLKGEFSANVSTGVDVHSIREPVGVVGIISPFNFPAMVPMWFFPIALAAGNTVILKPSEKDPSAALWLAYLLEEAGLPAGAFNVVHGTKPAVDALLTHKDVSAISFVGSTPIARYIYQIASENGKRVQALGGAKNHMLVLPDADLDLAADAAINAGFGSAGQRCMAVSVIVAIDSIADDLISKITERMSHLRIGDGRRGCDMGPLVSRQHRDKVASYIDIAERDGAHIIADGRDVNPDGDADGFWLGPTLIDAVPITSAAYTDEIFGPVLAIVRVKTYAEGVALINNSQFGNGAAIFTNDGGAARRFSREINAGMVGVNVPIPVPVAAHSFGGYADSAFGDARAYGQQGFAFYTKEKTVTTRWLDPSHAGINLGFPATT